MHNPLSITHYNNRKDRLHPLCFVARGGKKSLRNSTGLRHAIKAGRINPTGISRDELLLAIPAMRDKFASMTKSQRPFELDMISRDSRDRVKEVKFFFFKKGSISK